MKACETCSIVLRALSATGPRLPRHWKGSAAYTATSEQGAAQMQKKISDAVSIFVLPPTYAQLEWRLRNRGVDSEEVIQRRLEGLLVPQTPFEFGGVPGRRALAPDHVQRPIPGRGHQPGLRVFRHAAQ